MQNKLTMIFFGILFFGGIYYLILQDKKKFKVDLPEEISEATKGDTLIVLDKRNNIIYLGFKNK